MTEGSTGAEAAAGSAAEAASVGEDDAAADDGVAGCGMLGCAAVIETTEGCGGSAACASPSEARNPEAENCLQGAEAS